MDRGGEQEKKKKREKTGERTTVVTDTLKKKTKKKMHLCTTSHQCLQCFTERTVMTSHSSLKDAVLILYAVFVKAWEHSCHWVKLSLMTTLSYGSKAFPSAGPLWQLDLTSTISRAAASAVLNLYRPETVFPLWFFPVRSEWLQCNKSWKPYSDSYHGWLTHILLTSSRTEIKLYLFFSFLSL